MSDCIETLKNDLVLRDVGSEDQIFVDLNKKGEETL